MKRKELCLLHVTEKHSWCDRSGTRDARVLGAFGYSRRSGTRGARVLGALGTLGYSGRSATRDARVLGALVYSGRSGTRGVRVRGALALTQVGETEIPSRDGNESCDFAIFIDSS